jgi:hypothetical protein
MRLRMLLFNIAAALTIGAQPRDWTAHPAIVDREAPATVFAIGDIHGDYERLVRLLGAAGIVASEKFGPDSAAWTAADSVLVVTGDMIDKGPHPVAVLRLLRALQQDAVNKGGQVILLAGNHEVEFLAEAGARKAAEFAADLGKSGLSARDVAACRGDVGELLCSLPYAARVGDWFFSHAGNTGGRTIAQLSAQIQTGAYALTAPNSLLEARLGVGKKWFALSEARRTEEQLLQSYAAQLGVTHIVQGHQHGDVGFADGLERRPGEMYQRWGLLFLIDVGMSREVGDSQGALLKITRRNAIAVCPDGSQTVLWKSAGGNDYGVAAPCLK